MSVRPVLVSLFAALLVLTTVGCSVFDEAVAAPNATSAASQYITYVAKSSETLLP